ncbi:rho gtpase activation protein [Anaeramoeba flamelloides]|uniref:Rho gtpase activation protein n=1 Tax=Anaeramoeba flamelloides TaxID=1746091 RepID=A0AAV7YBT3_9EUKA|nr:rho gtpase activation protein [Anaeramoeba flamelloides]
MSTLGPKPHGFFLERRHTESKKKPKFLAPRRQKKVFVPKKTKIPTQTKFLCRSVSQETYPTNRQQEQKRKRIPKRTKQYKKKINQKTVHDDVQPYNHNQNQNQNQRRVEKKLSKQSVTRNIQRFTNTTIEDKPNNRNDTNDQKYVVNQKKKKPTHTKQKKKMFRGFSLDFKYSPKHRKNNNSLNKEDLSEYNRNKKKEFEEFLNQKKIKKIRDFKSESKTEENLFPILNSIDLNEYAKKNFSPRKKKKILGRKAQSFQHQLKYTPHKLQTPILKFEEQKDSKLALDLFEYLLYFMGEKKYVKKFQKKNQSKDNKKQSNKKLRTKSKKTQREGVRNNRYLTSRPNTNVSTNRNIDPNQIKNTDPNVPQGKEKAKFEQNDAIRKIIEVGLVNKNLRDEIYVQCCKQTINNGNIHSNLRAWGALCLVTQSFPPSEPLSTSLAKLLELNSQSKDVFIRRYARYARIKLDCIKSKKSGFIVPTEEMIRRIFAVPYDPIIFNVNIEDCMVSQKKFYPDAIIPYIVIYLTDKIKQTGGFAKEGLFRIPGNKQKVLELKDLLDRGIYDDEIEDPEMNHPFVYASLLKMWIRELNEPLIPSKFHHQIINCENFTNKVLRIVSQLPILNKLSLAYIVSFFKEMQQQHVLKITKMDINNLVLIFAPNLIKFKYESNDLFLIQKNSQKVKFFLSELIKNWKVDPYLRKINNIQY